MGARSFAGVRGLLRLANKRQLLGTFITLPRIEVVEMAAYAGFDLAVLDCEHAPIQPDALPALIAAGQGAGLAMMIRVAENRPQVVAAGLDAGADAVLVPHVNSGKQAGVAIRAARFPPDGERSVNPLVRGGRYGFDPAYGDNTATAVLVMLESRDALQNLPQVLAVEEVDAVFVGPMDLAASLGHLGDPHHRDVQRSLRYVFSAAGEAGKPVATFAATAEDARECFAQGAKAVVLSADTAFLRAGMKSACDETALAGRSPSA